MKIVLYTRDFRLMASPRHGGQGVLLNFNHRSAAQEAPSGVAAFIETDHLFSLYGCLPRGIVSVFIGNIQTNLNAQQGFLPRCLGSPQNAIPSEQVIDYHPAKRRGGKGGQAQSPPSWYLCFLFHVLIKGIL
jgi:hypothetical protein